MKIYLTAVIKAKKEYQTEVLNTLRNMVDETRKEKACELYSLHQGIENKNEFVFYEIWKNEEGLEQHNRQPYILAFGAIADEKLEEAPRIYKTHIL